MDEHSIICQSYTPSWVTAEEEFSLKVTQDKETLCKTCRMGALFVILKNNQKQKKNICSVKSFPSFDICYISLDLQKCKQIMFRSPKYKPWACGVQTAAFKVANVLLGPWCHQFSYTGTGRGI